ncbi:MAG: benzoate-CoA ligase family protein [Polyangiales bacterium]
MPPAPFAEIDRSSTPARLTFPRPYNAAVDLVDRHVVGGRGARVAVHDDAGATTYAELAARVAQAGHALRRLGVQVEQRVMLAMLDGVELVATMLGAMKIGAVPVPVNTLLAPKDYVHLLADSRARVLVVSDALLAKWGEAIAASPWLTHVVVETRAAGAAQIARAPLTTDARPEPLALEALLDAEPKTLEPVATSADDVAFWLYSSGSTGAPKGAMHLHGSLMRTAVLYAEGVLGIGPDDVVFSAAKLFFAYGLGNALTFPLSVGACAILAADRPTPAMVARTLSRHAATIFCGVPTLFASMLADPALATGALSTRLRVCTSAGEALPQHVGERWRARHGVDILDGIGSTEMLHIFLSNRPGQVRYGTTGVAVPGYDLELREDSDTRAPAAALGGTVTGPGEGALWVRGESAAIGYWNDRARSLRTFHGEWTRTGDRYSRDAEGFYVYGGRDDDMLKVGGIWVSPFEVESALGSHAAVLEAAVVGHPDGDGLIKPKAFVVLRDGRRGDDALAAELKAWVKERLAPYKYPRWLAFLDELPKTATGKIQRFRLRG